VPLGCAGGGKSLTFQLPALSKEFAVTVVVCPLIALAKVSNPTLDHRGRI